MQNSRIGFRVDAMVKGAHVIRIHGVGLSWN
jgi:hypothetical protein